MLIGNGGQEGDLLPRLLLTKNPIKNGFDVFGVVA